MHHNTAPITRSAGSPAYYMGRSAAVWQSALRSRTLQRTRARPLVDRTNGRVGATGHPGEPS
jgi:hypothetical protein